MTRKLASIAAVALLGAAAVSCKESNRQSSQVQLVVTTSQTLHRLDLKPGALNCNQSIGTVTIRNVLIQNAQPGSLPTNATLDDVQITKYRISYVRTDAGTSIPAPSTPSLTIRRP